MKDRKSNERSIAELFGNYMLSASARVSGNAPNNIEHLTQFIKENARKAVGEKWGNRKGVTQRGIGR